MCVCVLGYPLFPGQRSREASYFWLLSGRPERQRQQGAAAFCEVPSLPNTRPLIPLTWQANSLSHCVCFGVSVCARARTLVGGDVIGVVKGTGGGYPRNMASETQGGEGNTIA